MLCFLLILFTSQRPSKGTRTTFLSEKGLRALRQGNRRDLLYQNLKIYILISMSVLSGDCISLNNNGYG
jgi:hypothetical protein